MLYIVLSLEILFYTMFMKASKREGNIIGYIFTFLIGTIEMSIMNSNRLIAYLLFFLVVLLGMKFLARTKVLNYDILVLFIMCLSKLAVEFLTLVPLYMITGNSFLATCVSGVIKLVLVIAFSKQLNIIYNKLLDKWNKNNFYIRYFTSTIIMLYVIVTCIILIVQLI